MRTGGGTTALNWFISITSASFFSNWAIISFTNFRFHQALRAQDDKIFDQTYGWRSMAWPFMPAYLMVVSAMLLVCLLYAAISPLVCFSTLRLPFILENAKYVNLHVA